MLRSGMSGKHDIFEILLISSVIFMFIDIYEIFTSGCNWWLFLVTQYLIDVAKMIKTLNAEKGFPDDKSFCFCTFGVASSQN